MILQKLLIASINNRLHYRIIHIVSSKCLFFGVYLQTILKNTVPKTIEFLEIVQFIIKTEKFKRNQYLK